MQCLAVGGAAVTRLKACPAETWKGVGNDGDESAWLDTTLQCNMFRLTTLCLAAHVRTGVYVPTLFRA